MIKGFIIATIFRIKACFFQSNSDREGNERLKNAGLNPIYPLYSYDYKKGKKRFLKKKFPPEFYNNIINNMMRVWNFSHDEAFLAQYIFSNFFVDIIRHSKKFYMNSESSEEGFYVRIYSWKIFLFLEHERIERKNINEDNFLKWFNEMANIMRCQIYDRDRPYLNAMDRVGVLDDMVAKTKWRLYLSMANKFKDCNFKKSA